MSTNLYATLRRFSPWLSQTTRGWVWRPTRTPSGLPARRTASPCPALRRRVPTYLKEGSSASRGWLSQTATRTRLCSYKMYTCENNLSELFLIKPKCLFWQFFFFFLLDFSISTWWSCLKLKIQGPLRVLIGTKMQSFVQNDSRCNLDFVCRDDLRPVLPTHRPPTSWNFVSRSHVVFHGETLKRGYNLVAFAVTVVLADVNSGISISTKKYLKAMALLY